MWNSNTSTTFNSTQHHKPTTLTSYAKHKVSIPYFELILALAHVYSESNDGWRHWYYSTTVLQKWKNSAITAFPSWNVNYFLGSICLLLDWSESSQNWFRQNFNFEHLLITLLYYINCLHILSNFNNYDIPELVSRTNSITPSSERQMNITAVFFGKRSIFVPKYQHYHRIGSRRFSAKAWEC